jgi:ATP-dependent Clp protease ATP-binding subunit ClpC
MDDKRFTTRAKTVLELAKNKAREWGHTSLSTDHLLYGLYAEGQGVAWTVLHNYGVTRPKLDAAFEKTTFRVQSGYDPANPFNEPITYSPRCRQVFEYANGIAALMKHSYVGTEHLLMGLLEQTGGISMQLFKELDLDPKAMKTEIFDLLGHKTPEPDAPEPEETNYYKAVVEKIKQVLHEDHCPCESRYGPCKKCTDAISKIRDILKDS